MTQYISKAAVVAEIDRELESISNVSTNFTLGRKMELTNILSFLNTLEEVDLEKEVKDYIYTLPHSRTGIPGGWKCSWSEKEVIKIVKHFFGLGLKTQKEVKRN